MAAIGRILLMPKGDYNSSTIYNSLDWVRHAGSAWVCTTDNTTGIAPAIGVSEWQLLASDGSIGGWNSLAGKPFETIGDGLVVNASDELEVDTSDFTETTYDSTSASPISGQGVADAIASEVTANYYTKTDVDNKLSVVVKYGGKKTFAQLTSTLLDEAYENNFFMLSDDGYITSANINYWSDNYVVGDHIMVDSHIAIIAYTGSDPNKGDYVFDDFGGFVEVDEWTTAETCTTSNSAVIVAFDNLNSSYGYEINFVNSSNSNNIAVPTWTNLKREDGTNTGTIKLTYTLSGATSGTDQFRLRIKK